MAQFSMMWTTGETGDGTSPYTQAQVNAWLRRSFVNNPVVEGVIPDYPKTGGKELAVTGTASPVAVAPGAAWVYGFPYESTASETITVPTPVGGTTGHRVVLRANWTTQQVRLALISSANGNAAIPALTQNPGTIWEIPLASLTITTGGVITITDQRGFVHLNTRVSAAMMDANAVSNDAVIGNRTVSDGGSPSGNTGTLTTLLSWLATQVRRITGQANWWTAPAKSLAQLESEKVAKAGDTMTGALAVEAAAPAVVLNETDVAANNRRWVFSLVAGQLWGAITNDALSVVTRWLEVSRSSTTVTEVNFPSGGNTLKSGGETIWHAGNDGAGSGLDADLLDGLNSTAYARLGATSNFTTPPTINNQTIWHAGNDLIGTVAMDAIGKSVSFPPDTFTSAPVVIGQMVTTSGFLSVRIFNVTTSGFQATAFDTSGFSDTSGQTLHWRATDVVA
jgi:hypothetical protein